MENFVRKEINSPGSDMAKETQSGERLAAGDAQAMQLLEQLTLPEKVSLLAGRDFWSLPAIERLGIASLRMSDGPTGLRSVNSEPATVFPVGVALAATWNTALVREASAAIAREAIAHGVDVLLAPGVNIQRTPLGGRNFEYYSEDPCLSSEIAIAYVEGVQGEGVGTSVKHYAVNNQEHERFRTSANLSVRALREIYLASFEPIVRRARPWTVMSAYNRVNGVFASEHPLLLNEILKREWGFDGVVVSDWGAVKSTAASALNGLDLEMPGPARFYGAALLKACEAGEVAEGVIDASVLRVLRLIARCGLLDGNPKQDRAELASPAHLALSRRAAAEAMVLLRNKEGILPLRDQRAVALIGAIADYPAIQGGGSSQVTPGRIVTPLGGLRDALGPAVRIVHERGIDHEPRPPIIDVRLLSPEAGVNSHGLKATYFDQPGYTGEIVLEGVEAHFAKLGFGAAAQTEDDLSFSVEWSGFLTPRHSGLHQFEITHSSPDAELIIDGAALISADTPREAEMLFMILPLNRREAAIRLEAGRRYTLCLRYSQPAAKAIRAFNIFNVSLREPPPDRSLAIDAAAQADCAVVFVGAGTTAETEGLDRASMRLSDAQNALVEDVIAANPKTIVVVNTGAPVEMPWADRAAAIVQMWLPGQEGGHALADILTGAVSPSGKLPVTFPARYEDNPTALHYPGGLQSDYGEGIFVGYRYYDKADIAPLFPFGYGLSYTTFALSGASGPALIRTGGSAEISITVTNTGKRPGAETLQVYVEDRATAESMPPRQLRAFRKVHLEPGEARTLSFSLQPRDFAWFNPDTNNWQVTPGAYRVHLGTSSRDLPICLDLEIQG
jgi:beta-glucosidase